jgi:predicted RNase H-like nuclease (RuvC/YqgF family)
MFNSINNPFGQRIESAISTGQEKQHHQQNQQQEEEKKYLENDDKDEVKIGGLPILTEEEILQMTQNYIANLKSENEDKPKIIEKLDKFLAKFNIKKFMKQNPNMTSADFHMVMFNETSNLLN